MPPTRRPHRPGVVAPVSIQDAEPTGHTVLRCSPAKSRSMPSPTRCWTRVARCRASRIRPCRSASSATMRCAIGSSPPVPRCASAASAAPSRSPLRQRTSARSASASRSSEPAPAICSSSARASVNSPPRRWSRDRRASAVRIPGASCTGRAVRVRMTGSAVGSRSTAPASDGIGWVSAMLRAATSGPAGSERAASALTAASGPGRAGSPVRAAVIGSWDVVGSWAVAMVSGVASSVLRPRLMAAAMPVPAPACRHAAR